MLLLCGTSAQAFTFTPGDLVVSLVGNVNGSGPYTDNQATPIRLQELTATGTPTQSLLLPQYAAPTGGQYAISGEYGSSSEGLLHLSGDGHSLVIAGYGINAATYNAGGAAVYGDARLAQSTSVPGGAFTAVPRVIASISAAGHVDTSTALLNVFNTNNPRSVATVDGRSFYIAGQGASKTDAATQGVFYAPRGATTATQVTGSSDYRSVTIQNGQLYASRDWNGANGAQATGIARFTTALPTGASTPVALPGIGPDIASLTAALANGVNNARIGNNVYLSPSEYVFASDGTNQYLYIADTGNPKNGNINRAQLGEGGLQKWMLVNGTWKLLYDIVDGLGIIKNAVNNTTAVTSGTSGLVGLTGRVVNGVAQLYATNATLGDLDPTYVFAVNDPLAQTIRGATPQSDVFSRIYTAPAGTNVRGIAFAPTQAVPEPGTLALLLGAIGSLAALRRRR